MSTSADNDPNKPAIGYPYPPPPPPPAQSSYNHHPNGVYPPQPPVHSNYHQSGTGTGYPYTAPPPTTYYTTNPNPYPAHAYDPRRATFIRRLLIVMISAFILFGIITFIVWLVMRPRLPEFRVDSASVSGFNTSNSLLSANWDVSIFVRNPNSKMSAYYDRLDASVYYRRELLSETQIAPFVQGTKTETTVRVKFAASGTYVDPRSINQIAGERTGGSVNFNLRLLGWIKFRSGTWRTRVHLMRVLCEGVSVGFKPNSGVATLLGGPKKCGVGL